MRAELDRLTQKYNTQQRESIEMAILQREVDSNRQLYDGLLQRYKANGVAGVGTNNIAVVDSAKIPGKPRSEERRVGNEGVSKCRVRWWPHQENKKKKNKYRKRQ